MAAPYEKGYFFDNEERRIVEVSAYCPDITCIKIPDGGRYRNSPIRDRNLPPELVNSDYIKILGGIEADDTYDPESGIRADHIPPFHAWATENADKRRVVILDWDRTLTQIEGIIAPVDFPYMDMSFLDVVRSSIGSNPLTTPETCGNPAAVQRGDEMEALHPGQGETARIADQTLQYLCGIDRLSMLQRDIFGYCAENGIAIVILTNSAAAGAYGPDLTFKNSKYFKELTNGLLPIAHVDTPIIVKSSIAPRGVPNHKGRTLREDPLFGLICRASGGKTRKTRRKRGSRRKRALRTARRRLTQNVSYGK